MNDRETDSTNWSDSQVSALLGMGLMHPVDDLVEQSRGLIAELAADRSGKHLRAVVRDLRSPSDEKQRGPLSVSRLLGLPREQLSELHGRTPIEALTSARVSRSGLDAILRFSELLINDCFPRRTRITGAAMRLLALAVMKTRHGIPMDPSDAESLTTLLQVLDSQPGTSKTLRDSIAGMQPIEKK